jgi:hypothetical protein
LASDICIRFAQYLKEQVIGGCLVVESNGTPLEESNEDIKKTMQRQKVATSQKNLSS